MKNINKLTTIALAVIMIAFISCNKDDDQDNPNLANDVIGTYKGTLTTDGMKSTSPATADITAHNDYTVQVHCYGDEIDTTIFLELYQDGNMMRVCFTDDNFYTEYGHYQSQNHHMMGENGNWTNWNEHMNNDHNPNDQHYGYFKMDNHTFDYTFRVKTSSASYTQHFVGSIQ